MHISFFGRLGELKIPKRMIISDKDAKVGDTVEMMISYPEVIDSIDNLKERKKD